MIILSTVLFFYSTCYLYKKLLNLYRSNKHYLKMYLYLYIYIYSHSLLFKPFATTTLFSPFLVFVSLFEFFLSIFVFATAEAFFLLISLLWPSGSFSSLLFCTCQTQVYFPLVFYFNFKMDLMIIYCGNILNFGCGIFSKDINEKNVSKVFNYA